MKKKLFKGITLILMVAMLSSIVMLMGCNSSSSENKKPGKEQETKQENMGGDVNKDNFNVQGLPIVNEPVTIEVTVRHDVMTDYESYADMKNLKELEEITNVKVKWNEIASASWNEKKNLMFASGDITDAFWGEGIEDTDILTNLDYFLSLESLIDTYAPNIKKIFEKVPDAKKVVTSSDGHIYSMFRIRGAYFPNTMTVHGINKTWLDNLGLSMPTTTDELYDVLKAFKERDPNGNNEKDEIPLIFLHQMGNATISEMDFFPAFGVYNNTSYSELTYHLMVQDGKVVFSPTQEGYKEALKWMNRLYSEGLMDQEVFTSDSSNYNAKTLQGDFVGVVSGWTISNVVGFEKAEKDFVQLPPLKGPDGHQGWTRVDELYLGRNMFEITTMNKYPEVTMRWLDQIYDEEMSIQIFYGPFDEMTEKDANGHVTCLEPPEGKTYGVWRWGNTPADSAPYAILKEYEARVTPAKQQRDKDQFHKALVPFLPKEVYPSVFFSLEEINELKKIIPDINSYVEKMRAQFVTGGNIDAQWGNYVTQLEKMGLDKAMEVYTKAFERYNSN